MKEWLKFVLALIVGMALIVMVFALAIYCRDRNEHDAILPQVVRPCPPGLPCDTIGPT